jgi:hypothetical protein
VWEVDHALPFLFSRTHVPLRFFDLVFFESV